MRANNGSKRIHWAPDRLISWPAELGKLRRFTAMTGVVVCGRRLMKDAQKKHADLRKVTCKPCKRIAARARYEDDGPAGSISRPAPSRRRGPMADIKAEVDKLVSVGPSDARTRTRTGGESDGGR